MNVSVSKDEYLRIEDDIRKFKLDVFVGGGVYINPNVYSLFNLGIIINDAHVIYGSSGIAHTYYGIGYGYKFSLIH